MKKIVIKVSINCQICKTKILKATARLKGIDRLSVDGEKGTLSVVGDVDPVLVVKQLRKIGKVADIISVGPSKPPECRELKLPQYLPCLPSCKECQLLIVPSYAPYDGGLCFIL